MGHCPVLPEGDLGRTTGSIVLLGPDEPLFWTVFQDSAECGDGQPDPMDRWSRRVIDRIADDEGGAAIYPFGGPPYHPFFRWAERSGRAWVSPVGFLVHDVAGLFASFRGAIWTPRIFPKAQSDNPCLTCAAPCKTSCPVDALSASYDVPACKAHLASPLGADCMAGGCLARRACPVGADRRIPAQAAFHMKAFI